MMAVQSPLLPLPPETLAPQRPSERVMTCTEDERAIIRSIMRLYLGGEPFDLDPTYSTGRFWRGLPQPRLKMDIAPQAPGVVQADARALPLANGSVRSIMFDPPFVVAPSPKPGIIRDRFSCYPTVADLWAMYDAALAEFRRVLVERGGIVAFKCQDIVSGGVNHMTHAAVITMAQAHGFYVRDLFVLCRRNVLWSPNMANQKHARKNHSYFLVLETGFRRAHVARLPYTTEANDE